MIAALATLLGCQLAGEIIVRAFALPLPGPVVGLGLLFGALVLRGRRAVAAGADAAAVPVGIGRGADAAAVPAEIGRVADTLLGNLSLLFVPAAVGVVKYLDVLAGRAVPILAAIAVSTVLALIVTAATFRFMSRLHAFRHATPMRDIERAAGLKAPEPRP